MYINDKKLSQLLKDKADPDPNKRITVFALDFSKTVAISLITVWENIEYLSLRNNYLKDISFIPCFPMLFYLDLTGNPIEEFELLNKYNSFGYLGLTAPQNFLERNILMIKGLNIGILEFEIRNQLFKEQFTKNNPNVFYFNGYCSSFNEKIALINKADTNGNTNNSKVIPIGVCPDIISGTNNSIRDRFNVINDNPNKTSTKEFLSFIETYNKTMIGCLTANWDSLSLPTKTILRKEERKRLLMLSTIYKQISKYRSMTENTLTNHKVIKKILKSKEKKYHNINFKLFQLKSIPMQLLVLSIIYLYIIGIFSKQICIEILYSFHIKYNTQKSDSFSSSFSSSSSSSSEALKEDVESFFNLEYFYIVCFYFDIYSNFSALLKELKISETEDEKNKIDYGVIRYNDLRKSLKMLKLTMIIPQLELHHNSTGGLIKMNEAVTRNDSIQSILINFLLQEDIYKETLQIIQFVNDFLLLNKYESILVKDFANDYRLFHEIKEKLYKNIGNSHDSLSEKKYNEIKKKTLANKYFFKTKQYSHFTSLGTQLNRFYIPQKPTFYPVKPTPNFSNWSLNETEENEIKNTLKFSKELQNTLMIQSEKKKVNAKRYIFPQTQLVKRDLFSGPPPVLIKAHEKQRLHLKETSQLINQGSPVSSLFNYKEMKKRTSQSVTCLFSKAKKLPKLQLKSLKPIFIENSYHNSNISCNCNSNNNANKLCIDKQNKISFRLNSNQRNDCPSGTNTVDSFLVFEPKYK